MAAASFSLRILCCDYQMSQPILDSNLGPLPAVDADENKNFRKMVPIVRIFGSTPAGQKCCLHIHDVFPYFYVASTHAFVTEDYLKQLTAGLDYAINIYLQQKYGNEQQAQSRTKRFVRKIEPVQAKYYLFRSCLLQGVSPFYGYYGEESLFLRISLYNPAMIKRAADLLQSGAIMNTVFQPHEVHIPFILKFFIDNNLYGMDFVHVEKLKFRRSSANTDATGIRTTPGTDSSSSLRQSGAPKLWNVAKLSNSQLLDESIKRQTTCELECDCLQSSIRNTLKSSQMTKPDDLQNPGLRFIWEDERNRRRQRRDDSQIFKPDSQDRPECQMAKSETLFREVLKQKIEDWKSQPVAANADVAVTSPLVIDLNSPVTESVNATLILETSQSLDPNELAEYCSTVYGTDDRALLNLLEEMAYHNQQQTPIAQLRTQSSVGPLGQEFGTDKTPSNSVAARKSLQFGESLLLMTGGTSPLAVDVTSPGDKQQFRSPLPTSTDNEDVGAVEDDADKTPIACRSSATKQRSFTLTTPNCGAAMSPFLRSQPYRLNKTLSTPIAFHEDQGLRPDDPFLFDEDDDVVTREMTQIFAVNPADISGSSDEASPDKRTGGRIPQLDGATDSQVDATRKVTPQNKAGVGMNRPSQRTSQASSVSSSADTNVSDASLQSSGDASEEPLSDSSSSDSSLSDGSESDVIDDEEIVCCEMNYAPPSREEVELWSGAKLNRPPLANERKGKRSLLPSVAKNNVMTTDGKADASQSWKRRKKVKIIADATAQSSQQHLNSNKLLLLPCIKSKAPQSSSTSPNRTFAFDLTNVSLNKADKTHEALHVCTMSMELHVATRDASRPDPLLDEIRALFYCVHCDDGSCSDEMQSGIIGVMECESSSPNASSETINTSQMAETITAAQSFHNNDAVISDVSDAALNAPFKIDNSARKDTKFFTRCGVTAPTNLKVVRTERDLILAFVEILQKQDPDILVGFEVQMLSYGYLIERATALGIELCALISRVPDAVKQSSFASEDDWWSMVDLHIAGRVVMNLWRILRHEVSLNIYTFESVAFNVLRERVAKFSFRTLTDWFRSPDGKMRWLVLDYYRMRTEANVRLLLKCDIICRTAELAKLFGIQFYEVLSRGSQFRVESMMLRMTKAQNFIAVSPSLKQRGSMAAPNCVPLIMEPESRFYSDPVLVLDFQSLYPSMIIAYNYCYSTCLGKVQRYDEFPVEFGCYKYMLNRRIIEELQNDIHISPAGVAFVKSHVRRGVLPTMLEEILNTRLMVKNSMKEYKEEKALQKILDARQLGLKLIANVTYGYTSANFSGRMPCVEIADSIVHKGRETLEKAIDLVKSVAKWNAQVIYGDTDSMFVLLPGRSKSEAFAVGEEIAAEVTKLNPKPVKLKFEKVYYPCVLQTKKRYVGYSYESANQKQPTFDAKGIETVRRDTCGVVSKILKRAIHELFVVQDIDAVKDYVMNQFHLILTGRVPLKEFIFAKEYRGQAGYKPTACVPSLHIAKKRLQCDIRSEPRIGERVAYVVVTTAPNEILLNGVREPLDVVSDASLAINAHYYIRNQICAALNRVTLLLDEDSLIWAHRVAKNCNIHVPAGLSCDQSPVKATTEDSEEQSCESQTAHAVEDADAKCCLLCGELTTREVICSECTGNPQTLVLGVSRSVRQAERKWSSILKVCQLCVGSSSMQPGQCCISVDCPVFPKRIQSAREFDNASKTVQLLQTIDF